MARRKNFLLCLSGTIEKLLVILTAEFLQLPMTCMEIVCKSQVRMRRGGTKEISRTFVKYRYTNTTLPVYHLRPCILAYRALCLLTTAHRHFLRCLCVQPSEKDAGDYVCVIKNDAGEISKKISVAKSKCTFYYETVTFDIYRH